MLDCASRAESSYRERSFIYHCNLSFMLAIFTVPTAASVITSSTEYAGSLATEFLPLLYVVVGIAAAVGLVMFLRKKIGGSVRQVTGGGRRGRGRRR